MSAYQFDFARALGVLYPIGKRAAEPRLPPAWAPAAVDGLDFRPNLVPPEERCAGCQDWPTMEWYVDDEPSPARTCVCGFAPVVIHVMYEEQPIA